MVLILWYSTDTTTTVYCTRGQYYCAVVVEVHRNETSDKNPIAADARHRTYRPQRRRGIVTIDTTNTEIQLTTQWEKDRQLSLGRKEGWAHRSQATASKATTHTDVAAQHQRTQEAKGQGTHHLDYIGIVPATNSNPIGECAEDS
jgi:hypothetical protein